MPQTQLCQALLPSTRKALKPNTPTILLASMTPDPKLTMRVLFLKLILMLTSNTNTAAARSFQLNI